MFDSSPLPVIPAALLDRYLAGDCSDAERAAVAAWAADPVNAELLARLADGRRWRGAAAGRPNWDALRARLALAAAGDPAGVTAPTRPPRRATPHAGVGVARQGGVRDGTGVWSRLARYGAGVAVAVAAGVAIVLGGRASSHQRVAARQAYVTHTAQRATVTLRDGTRVTLAPQTSLVVDANFDADNRDVRVSGAAYFDVVSAAGRPFTVRAGSVTTRVLGTAFSVRHYATDPDVRIAVVSGRVAAERANATTRRTVLEHGMVARLSDSTVRVTSGSEWRDETEWVRNRLVFTDAPIAEVLATLGRWYGVEFRVTDSTLARQHVTAVFDGTGRAEMLQSLQALLEVTMTFDGARVTLSPAAAAAPGPRVRRAIDRELTTSTEVGR